MNAERVEGFRVAADAYDRHVGRYGTELAERLCAVAAVGPGQRVLDVGCGPGALTAVLAGLVGTGHVSAAAPSEPFVDACRARVPGADVRLGRAESLPFGDSTFDAVLSQLVVNFLGAPEAGVREMHRVTRSGGAVAAAVWDYAGGMTLHDVRSGSFTVGAGYESFDDLREPFAAGVGPSGAYLTALDGRAREDVLAEWRRRLGAPSGAFRLTARAWYAVGRA
jgi:SAM-dependent methyltransferase